MAKKITEVMLGRKVEHNSPAFLSKMAAARGANEGLLAKNMAEYETEGKGARSRAGVSAPVLNAEKPSRVASSEIMGPEKIEGGYNRRGLFGGGSGFLGTGPRASGKAPLPPDKGTDLDISGFL